jgi:hypothetical protein
MRNRIKNMPLRRTSHFPIPKKAISKWMRRRKTELRVAMGYGLIAIAFYVLACLSGHDGAWGAWLVLYCIGFPISWAITQVTARLGWLPDGIFGFFFAAGVIVAGMLSFYVIARVFKLAIAKFKGRRQVTR